MTLLPRPGNASGTKENSGNLIAMTAAAIRKGPEGPFVWMMHCHHLRDDTLRKLNCLAR
jgi:hypothetical protein